jgi:hypothetical protein
VTRAPASKPSPICSTASATRSGSPRRAAWAATTSGGSTARRRPRRRSRSKTSCLRRRGPLRLFQKRFSRPEDGSDRLFGYNESPFKTTIGPGFFVAIPTAGKPAWEERGAIVIDYFQIPDGPVPSGWPRVIPNTKGLQRFVYHRTRDYMRRVSAHVTIGAAFKEESSLDHYFILCRED